MNTSEPREIQVLSSHELVAQAEAQSLSFFNPKRLEIMMVLADKFVKSGALPTSIRNPEQALMIMQAGYEAGLQPLEAFNSFYFVNGKLSMYGDMVISQVRKAGHKITWGKCDATTATVTITRGDTGESLSNTFTMEMATQRGLTKNPVYRTAPENMLRFKAFHMTAKFICPEAIRGVQMKEIMETEVEVVEPQKDTYAPTNEAAPVSKSTQRRKAVQKSEVIEVQPAKVTPTAHSPVGDEGADEYTVPQPLVTEDQAKRYHEVLMVLGGNAESAVAWIKAQTGRDFFDLSKEEAEKFLVALEKKVSAPKKATSMDAAFAEMAANVKDVEQAKQILSAMSDMGADGSQLEDAKEKMAEVLNVPFIE